MAFMFLIVIKKNLKTNWMSKNMKRETDNIHDDLSIRTEYCAAISKAVLYSMPQKDKK